MIVTGVPPVTGPVFGVIAEKIAGGHGTGVGVAVQVSVTAGCAELHPSCTFVALGVT